MHLTDHVTDEQLNEYLDNESTERAQIEAHISSCDECAARLTALQTLFTEIESLPELELTRPVAVRFTLPSSLPVPQLPAWLTLTTSLQAVAALVAIIFATPIFTRYLAPVLQSVSVPSLNDMLVEIQIYFVVWMQSLQSIQLPTILTEEFVLPKEISPTILSISLLGIFFIWLIGNWWLLRKRPNSLA